MRANLLAFLERLGCRVTQTLRVAWLNVYSVLALALGVVFMVWVPQVRDQFVNLSDAGLGTHDQFIYRPTAHSDFADWRLPGILLLADAKGLWNKFAPTIWTAEIWYSNACGLRA